MGDYAPTYMTTYDTDAADVPLVALALATPTFVSDDPIGTVIGAISNQKAGSTLEVILNGGKVEIVGSNLVVGSVASTAGTFKIQIRETSQFATNSPKVTEFTITVTAP